MSRLRLRTWELVGVTVSLTLLVLLTWQVTSGGVVVRLDRRCYEQVGAVVSPVVDTLSRLGSPEVSGLILVVAAVHSAFSSAHWWPVLVAAGNGIGMAIVVLVLKVLIARPGPVPLGAQTQAGYFPSGHTATAAVCLGTTVYIVSTTGQRSRWSRHASSDGSMTGVVAGLAAGALVGSMTVLSGSHWVSDVVAGLAVSLVILVLGFALARRHLPGLGSGPPRRQS